MPLSDKQKQKSKKKPRRASPRGGLLTSSQPGQATGLPQPGPADQLVQSTRDRTSRQHKPPEGVTATPEQQRAGIERAPAAAAPDSRPATHEFTAEDTSVSARMNELLSQDSLYMQQAATEGRQAANRRGLLNSTMSVQAAQAGRVNAALPIASQEAAQANQRNLLGTEISSREGMQLVDLAAAKERLGMSLTQEEKLALEEIRSREGIAERDIESREGMQERDIKSREGMQTEDIAATRERLELELGSKSALQEAELAAEKERLGETLSHQERLALEELRAAEERLGLELESRERMQGEDIALNERLAEMNLSANERNAVATIAQSFETTYSQMVSAIMSNPDIPAAERQRYLNHAAAVRDSNLNLLEQFYGISLDWETPGGQQNNPNQTPPGENDPGSTPPNGYPNIPPYPGGPPSYPGYRVQ